jgi:hypothetical protein
VSVCDLLDDWDELGPGSERIEGISDLVTDLLESWGYDPTDLEFGDLADADCQYVIEDREIVIDPDFLATAGAEEAFDCALHELIHAAQHQSGVDLGGFLPELEAQLLASKLVDEIAKSCESEDVPESGAEGNLPDNPWECVLEPE